MRILSLIANGWISIIDSCFAPRGRRRRQIMREIGKRRGWYDLPRWNDMPSWYEIPGSAEDIRGNGKNKAKRK